MAIQFPGTSGDPDSISEINTTPLVDVMLVLLIIFLITIPVVNFSVPVELPQARSDVRETKPRDIVISVDAQGTLHWLDAPLSGDAELLDRLRSVARMQPQPEVHIRADRANAWLPVGRILNACGSTGILRVGFVSDPGANAP